MFVIDLLKIWFKKKSHVDSMLLGPIPFIPFQLGQLGQLFSSEYFSFFEVVKLCFSYGSSENPSM